MKVLIDTNVILDVAAERDAHIEHSAAFLDLCGIKIKGFMAASQTTDIFNLLCRGGMDMPSAKAVISKLADHVKVLDVTAVDVKNALTCEIPDYEDALLAYCAKRQKADYIVTRNQRDFELSPVAAVSPEKFLEQFFSV